MPSDRAKDMAAGMNSHVSKPIDLKDLALMLNDLASFIKKQEAKPIKERIKK